MQNTAEKPVRDEDWLATRRAENMAKIINWLNAQADATRSVRDLSEPSDTRIEFDDFLKMKIEFQIDVLQELLAESKGHVTICRGALIDKIIELRQEALQGQGNQV